MAPEFLALVHVRDVDFDDRRLESIQSIQQRHRGVGERRRVDDDPTGDLTRFVNPLN
jgi:hypothetical protein